MNFTNLASNDFFQNTYLYLIFNFHLCIKRKCLIKYALSPREVNRTRTHMCWRDDPHPRWGHRGPAVRLDHPLDRTGSILMISSLSRQAFTKVISTKMGNPKFKKVRDMSFALRLVIVEKIWPYHDLFQIPNQYNNEQFPSTQEISLKLQKEVPQVVIIFLLIHHRQLLHSSKNEMKI